MAHLPPGPWHEFPELWDKCILGDLELPGLSSIEVLRQNKWDTKKSKGSHGGERQFGGVDLAKVKIETRFWTAEQWEKWLRDVFPLIEPGPKDPSVKDAIAISHVVSDARKVAAITIDAINGPWVESGIGVIEIEATEYREPDKTNANGKAGGMSGDCGALAANLALLEGAQKVDHALFNAYLKGSLTNPFDPNAVIYDTGNSNVAAAEEVAARMTSRQVEIDNVKNMMLIRGCNQAPASASDPKHQSEAEELAA